MTENLGGLDRITNEVQALVNAIKSGELIHFDEVGKVKASIRRVLRGNFRIDAEVKSYFKKADRFLGQHQDEYLERASRPDAVAEAWGTQVRTAYGERHGPQDFGSIEGATSDTYQAPEPETEVAAPSPREIGSMLCPECGSWEYPEAGMCVECGSLRPDNTSDDFEDRGSIGDDFRVS